MFYKIKYKFLNKISVALKKMNAIHESTHINKTVKIRGSHIGSRVVLGADSKILNSKISNTVIGDKNY